MKKAILLLLVLWPTISLSRNTAFRPTRDARKAAVILSENQLKGHIRFLSSDLLEGRAPASNGEAIAKQYISSQFESLGLQPILPNQSWFQEFDIVGINSFAPKTVKFYNGTKTLSMDLLTDYIAVSGQQSPKVSVNSAEVVFVGYGIVAPEYGWDDYKGLDVKGKILLMMNNDPADDPKMFAGKTRLYYGRWDYKYAIAEKKGAAGAFIIHTTPSAGYPWQVVQTSWSGEQFELPNPNSTISMKGWITESMAKKLATFSGYKLDELRASAERKDFQPVPMKTKFAIWMSNKVRSTKTANVLGILPGSDPELSKEAVIYMAHYDHLGKNEQAKPGEDAIYNGALDNASGVASLLNLAKAYSSLETKPKRSILFAAVGAEESGLLGSEYFSANPPIKPGKMAAVINMDCINIWGRAKDINMIGLGKSSLDQVVESIAKMQGRYLVPDQEPDKGYFYRSDQFNLAKIGVPAAYFHSGIDVIGKGKEWGKTTHETWTNTNYHQPSDEMKPDWNFEGALEDLQLNFYLGYAVANEQELPRWNKGDEFEAARLQSVSNLR